MERGRGEMLDREDLVRVRGNRVWRGSATEECAVIARCCNALCWGS